MSSSRCIFIFLVILLIVFGLSRLGGTISFAQSNSQLLPLQGFTAFDTPNDVGDSVGLIWKVSENDREGVHYIVSTAPSQEGGGDGQWTKLDPILSTTCYKSDFPQYFGIDESNKLWHFYEVSVTTTTYFKLAITDGVNIVEFPSVVSATPKGNWFDTSKVNILVCVIFFSGLIMFFIRAARHNPNLFIRHIPGLDAIEETIGRATEMGKPILYLNGLHGMDSLSTIASISILSKVASKVANYDSQIKVPCYDPIVMSVCQEVIKEAYIAAGRPDAFKSDNIFFITNDQFAYAAAVEGMMMRDKPAANLYMGYYYAEALLLSETGAATGAMQIAGTDSITQLPFFITTCDYTLMGEELYASSAYLSREPLQLGSLKGQDVSKALIILILFIGSVLTTFGVTFLTNLFRTF
ncbi:MAG: hypothetical protein QME51_05690 [Planctomycetota bacterium]|nr:hypothetical protein [Planctomycetota bacterium]MDI6787844.1 hypothetical protein [Planctomycetota bacterium]